MSRQKQHLTTLLFVALLIPACKGKQETPTPAATAPPPAAMKKTGAAPPADPRQGHHVVRSLLAEASRAELWQSGQFIQFGTPDQHKYTVGGWRAGWGETGGEDKTPYCEAGKRAKLRLVTRAEVKRVVLYARAPGGEQRLELSIDGDKAATAKVTPAWGQVRLDLEAPLKPGHHRLGLRFKRAGVQVAWAWLPEGGATLPPSTDRTGSMTLGSPRRALLAGPPRRFSYHLVVPPKSALVFAYGARKATRFWVTLSRDGAAPEVIWKQQGGPKWRQAAVDLSAHAGRLVRLDLETTAKLPGAAGWGEPDIMKKGPRPRPPLVTPANRAKNLIYLLIDTARQDAYAPFNPNSRVHAPAMTALAADSLLFDNAFNNDNWTKPSVATALSGLYSSTHGTTGKYSVLPREVTILPEHLRSLGFDTAGFIANGYVSDKFGFKVGWRTYRNYIREDLPYEAKQVFADALEWLDKPRDKRFFLYIQTIDPHVPYAVPRAFLDRYYPEPYKGSLGPSISGYETKDWLDGKRKFTDDDKRYIRAMYDAEISYHDHYMGKFLAALKERGLLDDTLLVVSNDHGEEMFDHGKIGHGHTLYEEMLRNPLIMRYPGLLKAGARVPDNVGLVDLAPTMLDLLQAPHIKGTDGVSLLPTIFGRPPLGESYEVSEQLESARAVHLGRYKLVVGLERERLHDLDDDPGEERDLLRSHPVARRGCEVYLGEGLGTPAKSARLRGMAARRKHRASEAAADPKLKRQLEALGYIE